MNDQHYAVVVGINEYPWLSNLRGPVADADAFTAWLTSTDGGGLSPKNVRRVERPAGAGSDPRQDPRPWTADVYDALDWANQGIEQQMAADPTVWQASRLYLFVAGHGITPSSGEGALLAANASMRMLGYNVELGQQCTWYKKFGPFREIVVFADCCRVNKPFVPGYGPPFNCVPKTRPEQVRVVVGWGSVLGGESFEDTVDVGEPDARRGYFTEALVAGLCAGPRDPMRGVVTATTLNGFVAERVKQRASKDGRQQTASITGPDDFTFGTGAPASPPCQATDLRANVSILFPTGFSGGAAVLDRTFTVVDRSEAAPLRWTVSLLPGQYQVTPLNRAGRPDNLNAFAGNGIIIAAGVDVDVQL